MREGVGVDAVVAAVHHIIVEVGVAGGGDFESFVATASCYDGVCGCDRWDDVFDDTLGKRVRDASDLEFVCAGERFLVEPRNVFGVIVVKDVVFAVLFPGYYVRPFDAVLRLAGDCGEGTEGNGGSGSVHVKLTFDTGC